MRAKTAAKFISIVLGAGVLCAAPSVAAVYPSGPSIPENLLRISVRFAHPVAGSEMPGIKLERSSGSETQNVFDRDVVWSPDLLVLTLLLGPGRVKTGLNAHNQLGRALLQGESVALSIDGKIVKSWRVTPALNQQINPNNWALQAPGSARMGPVRISFPAPIDAMDKNYLVVLDSEGHRVAGQAMLTGGEREWQFVPDAPWADGHYAILVNPRLEDPCGNSVSTEFEISGPVQSQRPPAPLRLRFRVG
jgi:hypothetical protein